MKIVTSKSVRLRFWHVVYLLFVMAAVGGPSGATADDTNPVRADLEAVEPAQARVEDTRWTYTRSVRVELARGEHLRVETTIPLDRVEEPRLTVSMAKQLSRSWAFEFVVWTSL